MISSPPKLKYNYMARTQNSSSSAPTPQLIQSRETIDKLNKEKEYLNQNLKDLILENFQLKNIIEQQKKQQQQPEIHHRQKEQETIARKQTPSKEREVRSQIRSNTAIKERENQPQMKSRTDIKQKESRTSMKSNAEVKDKSGDAHRIIRHSHMVDDISFLEQQMRKPTLIEQLSQSQFKRTGFTPRTAKHNPYESQNNSKISPSRVKQQNMITPPKINPQTHKKIFELSNENSKTSAQKANKNTNKPYLHSNSDYLQNQYRNPSAKEKPQYNHSVQQEQYFRVNPQTVLKAKQDQNSLNKKNNTYLRGSPGPSTQESRHKPSCFDYIPSDYQRKSPSRLIDYRH